MKTILKIFGYIIGILLMAAGLIAVVALVFGFGTNMISMDTIKDQIIDQDTTIDASIITSMTPVESATPAPDGNTLLEDTQQNGTSSLTVGTPTPAPTPTPEVTPAPTPVPTPTPEPQPLGTPLGGGTFSSNTEKWIDVDAIWNAEANDVNTVKITVVVNLRSYTIHIGEKRNALEIAVGDETTAMDVQALQIQTDKIEVTTELGRYEFVVDAPIGKATIVPLTVNWHFGGVYSGTQMPVITAEGDIVIDR